MQAHRKLFVCTGADAAKHTQQQQSCVAQSSSHKDRESESETSGSSELTLLSPLAQPAVCLLTAFAFRTKPVPVPERLREVRDFRRPTASGFQVPVEDEALTCDTEKERGFLILTGPVSSDVAPALSVWTSAARPLGKDARECSVLDCGTLTCLKVPRGVYMSRSRLCSQHAARLRLHRRFRYPQARRT